MKTKRIVKSLLLSACLVAASGSSVLAQRAVKSGGNALNFVNSNAFGGQLGHEQVFGTFGTFAANSQWIGIGQPTFGGALLPFYGSRIQWGSNLATHVLENTGDVKMQWGGSSTSTSAFDFNFVFNPTTGAAGERNVMHMTNTGRVGVGNVFPNANLDVRTPSTDLNFYSVLIDNQRTNGGGLVANATLQGVVGQANDGNITSKYGVSGSASGDGEGYGVYGVGKIENGLSFGVYGLGAICNGTGYGVYGTTVDICGASPIQYAGYFDGDVVITGGLTVLSDGRLKKDVKTETNALARVMQLRPTTYTFDREKYNFMHLDQGLNHGFIAQEVEEIFPELIKQNVHPVSEKPAFSDVEGEIMVDENGSEVFKYKSVNYVMLIPVLTKAIQEQQVQLEEEKSRNDALAAELNEIKAQLATLTGSSDKANVGLGSLETNVLFQNTPNPFDQLTTIAYTTVRNAQNVNLRIYDLQGREIRVYENLKPGKGEIKIEGSQLDAGMYIYTLIVDGKEAGTKRMILTKN